MCLKLGKTTVDTLQLKFGLPGTWLCLCWPTVYYYNVFYPPPTPPLPSSHPPPCYTHPEISAHLKKCAQKP